MSTSSARALEFSTLFFFRLAAAAAVIVGLVVGLFTAPKFFSQTAQESLRITLEIDTNRLHNSMAQALLRDVQRMRREGRLGFIVHLAPSGDEIQVRLREGTDSQKVLARLSELSRPLGSGLAGGRNTLDIENTGRLIRLTFTKEAVAERVRQSIDQSIKVLQRRIDGFGSQATIVRDGTNRIRIQMPRPQETTRLKALISQPAKLTFQLVHPTMTVEEARTTRIPTGYKIYQPYVPPDQPVIQRWPNLPELLQTRVIMSGEDVVDAQKSFDQRDNQPVVTFRFNTRGAKRFGRATQRNVGRRFAIVLDNKVISAPVIQEPILGGSGQISGNFSVNSAGDLAVLLRSGELPSELSIIRERVIAPAANPHSRVK